jgi:glycosyltransferase involved in cell wall biosynthesis
LQVTGDLYPFSLGGIGVVVDSLSNILVKNGFDVDVITYQFSQIYRPPPKVNYQIKNYKYHLSLFGNRISLPMITDLFKLYNNYSVVHAHSHLFFSTFICALVRKTTGKSRLIITNHGLYSQSAPFWLSKIWLKTIGKFIYNTADGIICLKIDDKIALINLGIDPDKISIIPNGIDINIFSPDFSKTDDNRILFIGRLVHGKGVRTLLQAFLAIRQQFPHIKLIIVGSGPEKQPCVEFVIKHSMMNNVEFKAHLSQNELIHEYRTCNYFILPSFTEGLPLTILEAMGCGKPIITTPNNANVVGEAGLIVPYNSKSALVSAMKTLLDDHEGSLKMGKSARKIIEQKYSIETFESSMVHYYNNEISGKINS